MCSEFHARLSILSTLSNAMLDFSWGKSTNGIGLAFAHSVGRLAKEKPQAAFAASRDERVVSQVGKFCGRLRENGKTTGPAILIVPDVMRICKCVATPAKHPS